MDIQKSIAAALCEKEVGKVMEVLIEGKLPEENIFCGRTRRDAPEIDGLVFVSSEEELYSGDFVTVRIREAGDYDLMGDVVYGNDLANKLSHAARGYDSGILAVLFPDLSQ